MLTALATWDAAKIVMSMEITSFDVLKFMSEHNEDIRLAPLSNIISADKNGMRCTITIVIDEKMFSDYMNNKKFVGGLIFADQKRFLEIKEALSEDISTNHRL
jgi:hypothetical protein